VTAIDVSEQTFAAEVVERSSDLPVVVDFWAEWCGPCRALGPVLEREAEARAGRVVLVKVDVDANPGLAQAFGIRGIPAVKAFRGGRVVREFVGAQTPQTVAAFLDDLLGPSGTERLVDELSQTGEFPEILGPLAEGDYERALEWLLARTLQAPQDERDRVRDVMVAIFRELGQDHALSTAYRRRLATALY
jgi:putative thioredoxin